jgi:hypothetical protein
VEANCVSSDGSDDLGIDVKSITTFILQVFVAMVVSIVLGGVLCAIAQTIVGPVSPQYWAIDKIATDAPYSPALWGSGLGLGFLVNRRLQNRSACYVWAVGLCWLSLWVWDAIDTYHASSCQGCSVAQNIWRNLFTVGYHTCSQDCLGEVFGTAPTLSAIAYSLGAFSALRSFATKHRLAEK